MTVVTTAAAAVEADTVVGVVGICHAYALRLANNIYF